MALQKILDSHLSAKYSYVGRLGKASESEGPIDSISNVDVNNITSDGFYDMGPVKEGNKFLTIEELASQDVNDRRPVLIVYAPETK